MPTYRPSFSPYPPLRILAVCGTPPSSDSTNSCVKFWKIMTVCSLSRSVSTRVRLVPSLLVSSSCFSSWLWDGPACVDAVGGSVAPVRVGESVGRSVAVHLPRPLYHPLSITCNASFYLLLCLLVRASQQTRCLETELNTRNGGCRPPQR